MRPTLRAALIALATFLAAAGLSRGQEPPAPASGEAPSQATRPTQRAEPVAPMEFDTYQLVLLERPAKPTEYPEAKLQEIQAAHLAHLRRMAREGHLVVAGPFDDQDDLGKRGLALYRVGGVEEARRLAEADPAVRAGRLKVEVMTWYTEKGALAFPGVEKYLEEHPPEE